MTFPNLGPEEIDWLREYLKGQREVNQEVMETEELLRLNEVIAAFEPRALSLKSEIQQMKISAFDTYKLLSHSAAILKNSGYKAAHEVLDQEIKRIEARIEQWEKDHPDH